ncbi:MAG: DUF4340 domain-containing protein [Anaerolineae bacterium]|nr:DUF4340 domain-containing protein [Anaerolineae bacterium]
MNFKTTIGLIILLVALASYIYFFEIRGNDDEAGPTDPTIYGPEYGEYDLVALEIEGPQGTAHFARTDETLTQEWEMLAPTPVPAEAIDQVRVNGAVTRLGYLKPSRVITHVTNLAQYGLNPPQLTVTLIISNGQKIILYTGHETPVKDNRYLRLAGDEQTVYLVFSFAINELHRLLNELPLALTPVAP